MLDVQVLPVQWGLFPTVLGLPSYPVFVLLALLVGCVFYFRAARRANIGLEHAAIVLLGALLGAGLGAKLPMLALYAEAYVQDPFLLVSGKTMLGGLLGGICGGLLAKRAFCIRSSFGDISAKACAIGFAIGRLGCLGAGCCYGRIALWGLHLGDGFTRYPTQVFEIIFHICAFLVLCHLQRWEKARGAYLQGYLGAYLLFRYLTEYFREGNPLFAGQTIYQLYCVCGLVVLLFLEMHRRGKEKTA